MSTEAALASAFSHKNPFPARHLKNLRLTGAESEKDTRHHEISLAGSGLRYSAGDALGVVVTNEPGLVEDLIKALHATGEEAVIGRDGTPKPLRAALFSDYAITFPDKKFVEACVMRGATDLAPLLEAENIEALRTYLSGHNESHDYLDILQEHPQVAFGAEDFVKLLRKLPPRLYSIASSLNAHPDEVHLTVVTVAFRIRNRLRKGVASTFIAERWEGDTTAGVFVQSQQRHFFLPPDATTPIIMVGPGTGVAPFRAFLEERQITGSTGRNWLFFGEQRESQNFFYREQFTQLVKDGRLRLDLAFSRDQPQKVYVQTRLAEQGKDVWAWLEEGAHFFVCGDKERMATDVDATLHRIIEQHGGRTPEQAKEYVDAMKKEKRYKRDVY